MIPAGHVMTYKHALHVVTTDFFFKLLLPDWALNLTERTRNVATAFDELRVSLLKHPRTMTLIL